MINRVTLGPPDGDLYASIPDDIGLQRGSAEKLSNDYTYPPFEDHALTHPAGQSTEFEMKMSTEVPANRPAGRVEADILGPLAGDSYTCVPGRTDLGNFVSVIDTAEPLSIRNPHESLPKDGPYHSLGNISEILEGKDELFRNRARPEADVLGPLDGDSYTCIPGGVEVLDSLLPLTDTNEILSNDNYNTIQEDSVSYDTLKIKPDLTGRKNRATKPEAEGTSQPVALQLPGDDSYSTIPIVQFTPDASSDIGNVEDPSNGNICLLNSGNSFCSPTGNTSECYEEISKNKDTIIKGLDTNVLGPLHGDVYASISNQNEITSRVSMIESDESFPYDNSQNSFGKNEVHQPIEKLPRTTMGTIETTEFIPTNNEKDGESLDTDMCACISRRPSLEDDPSNIEEEDLDCASSQNDDDEFGFVGNSLEELKKEAGDTKYGISSGCQALSVEPLDCNIYGDISKQTSFANSISMITDTEQLSGNVTSLYSLPESSVSCTNGKKTSIHLGEHGSYKSGAEKGFSSRDQYEGIPVCGPRGTTITNDRGSPSDNCSCESIPEQDSDCQKGNSPLNRCMESERSETRLSCSVDKVSSHGQASGMYASIPDSIAVSVPAVNSVKHTIKNTSHDGYESIPDHDVAGNSEDIGWKGGEAPDSRHKPQVLQPPFHSPADDMYASIPD